MIRIRDLRVDKSGETICHVRAMNVGRGERVAVIGPNGSGKSTLLRVIAGLENQFAGQCQVDVRRRDRVFVHQSPYLLHGSVMFNVRYGLAARSMPRRKQHAIALRWLQTLGVDHLAHRRCTRLSGGEQRRVALARAFVLQPEVLLLDEPLADLDQAGIEVVCQAVRSLAKSTVLIASPVPLPEDLAERSHLVD
jgi:tungstate transport system ATP-binding protein